uniref:Putative secreted protein n=1 Tax=Ixodes ricinus TaxID=34613 RepID=A0A147BET6_IXORI
MLAISSPTFDSLSLSSFSLFSSSSSSSLSESSFSSSFSEPPFPSSFSDASPSSSEPFLEGEEGALFFSAAPVSDGEGLAGALSWHDAADLLSSCSSFFDTSIWSASSPPSC